MRPRIHYLLWDRCAANYVLHNLFCFTGRIKLSIHDMLPHFTSPQSQSYYVISQYPNSDMTKKSSSEFLSEFQPIHFYESCPNLETHTDKRVPNRPPLINLSQTTCVAVPYSWNQFLDKKLRWLYYASEGGLISVWLNSLLNLQSNPSSLVCG